MRLRALSIIAALLAVVVIALAFGGCTLNYTVIHNDGGGTVSNTDSARTAADPQISAQIDPNIPIADINPRDSEDAN